jgi:GDP-L-fucose synthase
MRPLPAPIYVAGHRGMVGSAILRALAAAGEGPLLTRDLDALDLTNAAAVEAFFAAEQPATVILAAARVGGIHANATYPADFIRDNLLIQTNVIDAAWRHGSSRLLFLGSSCIYPRLAPQPIREDALLTGPLEPTNEAYALAKIAGLKLCQYLRRQYGVCFHSVMPTNLYGPGDNYHAQDSHVLPAFIRRFHEARERGDPTVTIWGSGTPRREFLHTDDLAAAVLHVLRLPDPPDWVNIGTGEDIPIRDLAALVAEVVGYRGTIANDPTKPDGTPRKLLDVSRLFATGWQPRIGLRAGIAAAYADFRARLADGTARM